MCGWTTRRLANSAIAMIGRARHRRIKKRRRYERSAGTEPVLPVVIFLTPLSSNFSIKRIGRPTFLLILFAPLLKGEVKGGAPLKPLLRLRQQHKLRRLLSTTRYSQVLVQRLPLPLLQRLELWQNEKNVEKPWETHLQTPLGNELRKSFFIGLAYAVKKKWRKKFY